MTIATTPSSMSPHTPCSLDLHPEQEGAGDRDDDRDGRQHDGRGDPQPEIGPAGAADGAQGEGERQQGAGGHDDAVRPDGGVHVSGVVAQQDDDQQAEHADAEVAADEKLDIAERGHGARMTQVFFGYGAGVHGDPFLSTSNRCLAACVSQACEGIGAGLGLRRVRVPSPGLEPGTPRVRGRLIHPGGDADAAWPRLVFER